MSGLRRAGFLLNPLSGGGNPRGLALLNLLQDKPDISKHVLAQFSDLESALQKLAQDDVTDLFISGGDGTIQAAMTLIAATSIWKTTPRLCILPHGTTNLSANDLGLKLRAIPKQAEFIKALAPRKIKTRNTLCLENPDGPGPQLGFTFGAGAAAVATKLTQQNFNARGVRGNYAVAGTLLKLPFDAALHRPYAAALTIDEKPAFYGNIFAMVATSLEKLFFGADPFWGKGDAPINLTLLPHPSPNAVLWFLPLIYARHTSIHPKGAISANRRNFSLLVEGPLVMDGEFFTCRKDEPLRVSTGPAFEFLCG